MPTLLEDSRLRHPLLCAPDLELESSRTTPIVRSLPSLLAGLQEKALFEMCAQQQLALNLDAAVESLCTLHEWHEPHSHDGFPHSDNSACDNIPQSESVPRFPVFRENETK